MKEFNIGDKIYYYQQIDKDKFETIPGTVLKVKEREILIKGNFLDDDKEEWVLPELCELQAKDNNPYTFKNYGYGGEIVSPDGQSVCFVQGDDYDDLVNEILKIDALWESKKPNVPFDSYESHLSAFLESYIN